MLPVIGVKDLGVCAKPGNRHGVVSQDRHGTRVVTRDGRTFHVAAVFDGHGIAGELAAEACRDTFLRLIDIGGDDEDLLVRLWDRPEECFPKLFSQLNQAAIEAHEHAPNSYSFIMDGRAMKLSLERKKNQPAMYVRHRMFGRDDAIPIDFGTTAVVAIHADGKLVVANAGDSSAILYSCSPADPTRLSPRQLSTRHTAEEFAEVERLQATHGDSIQINPDGYFGPSDGPMLDWLMQNTRSLGHKLMQQYGITCEPAISVTRLDSLSRAVVLCSDGLTDDISLKAVGSVIQGAPTAQAAADALFAKAWRDAYDPDDVDDISVIVMTLGRQDTAS
eukprot:m.16020 g.16020  ORF g.16020 m.16020 type:complete len:334 (-) comp5137_c1_seq1:50-1051(-)